MEENRVKLDGEAIRRIREEKRLTQLYVAKVVGVTTDTVSRWENNRYPSVRRENAVQLAEALEVPVSDVLRADEMETGTVPSASPSHRNVFLGAGIVFLLLTLGWFFWPSSGQLPPVRVERFLPVSAAPQSVIPVRLHITSDPGVDGLVLREDFPPGWQVIEASPPPSSLDNVNGSVRWIVQKTEAPLRFSYLVRVAAEPNAGMAVFRGEVVVSKSGRSYSVPVEGGVQARIAPFHWADANGDLVIDDSEALEASVASIEMKKIHLDWATVEKIWDAGSYRYDADHGSFAPVPRERR